ncbi:hypothetical protein B4589_016185 (plasmid) [Halolamina sp. CBA1230]|uniref:DUF7344 domain-containing protein n=1 Tax=Halolamina sp. CBA1230 TaxID=1853690 RepID=UPI0009A1685B|nr:hypothetical protein [Halolamina sp. CBA1230]QKY21950.1 hypothetical protein B4589_016185 [Halolamina sp. CBA1230]
MHSHETITDNRLFELLAHPQRRRMLRRIAATDGTVTVDELVDSLAIDGEATHEARAIAVHHRHLPKLEEYGVVESGPGGAVEPGAAFDDAVSLLRRGAPCCGPDQR